MNRGHSEKCSIRTQKWDQDEGRCVNCPLPGPGKQLTANCGYDDEGGIHELPSKNCPEQTFNDGTVYLCIPCSSCVSGYKTIPCTKTKDTECQAITTIAPVTTILPDIMPTQYHIPVFTNQTIDTSITVSSRYESSLVTHTIPVSAGTFWGLAALFMIFNKKQKFNPFHCGGDGGFSDNLMFITNNFKAATNCSFVLAMSDNSSTIGIDFKQMDLSDDCNQEYVELFDGSADKSMGKYCGTELPPFLKTTSSDLLIDFVSFLNSSGSTGFIGHFYQIIN